MRRLHGPTKSRSIPYLVFVFHLVRFELFEDPDLRPSELCLFSYLLLLLLLIRVVLLFCMIPLCTDMGRRGTSY